MRLAPFLFCQLLPGNRCPFDVVTHVGTVSPHTVLWIEHCLEDWAPASVERGMDGVSVDDCLGLLLLYFSRYCHRCPPLAGRVRQSLPCHIVLEQPLLLRQSGGPDSM